jgi:hypothetical protein
MSTLEIAKVTGGKSAVPMESLEALGSKLRGSLIRPVDQHYDEARQLWNGIFDKRPAAIARCHGVADVIDAVQFARDLNLLVAVRGGAHNVAGLASYDDSFVIDLSQMRSVHVNPQTRIARVEAGARLGDIDRETQVFGLVMPTGVVSETGIAGLTLSGGVGWLRRKWGMTCDNLLSLDLVTAGGNLVTASKNQNEDLFWALHGGGGNFGIVTSFEFGLHPLGPEVMFCFVMYPAEGDIVYRFREYARNEPDEVGILAFTGAVPAGEPFPPEWWHKHFFVVAACFAGSAEEGERILQPLRQFGKSIVDFSGPMPFTRAQQFLDADYPAGRNYYWKSVYLNELNDDTVKTLLELNAKAPSHHSTLDIWTMGGALGRVGAGESPLSPREAAFMIGVEANWDDPKDSQRNVAWARECVARLGPFAAPGIYLNFPGFLEDSDELVRNAFGSNLHRLAEVKKKYDPDNFFRLNQNIKPIV